MVQRVSVLMTVLLFMLFCVGCLGPKRADTFQPLDVSFEWNGNAGSLSSPNPEILVKNVPAGTAYLDVRMMDRDMTSFFHGGGTVPYDGTGVIPVGALKNYQGPEPPSTHTYTISVKALNADKTILLGEGSASRQYP